jgi:uncharacterized MAPEG superfamily protein
MNSKELFALFLRIVGVLGIIYVIRRIDHQESPAAFWLVMRLIYLIIGAYLIRGAPLVLEFAYPEKGGEATTPKN